MLNDQEDSHATFQANWQNKGGWDKSSLEFRSQEGNCETIKAFVFNGKKSGGMDSQLTYEVYYNQKGNPKKGVKLVSGTHPPLKAGEEAILEHSVNGQAGVYMFKAYQSPGHPGKGELWSKEIVVNCKGKEQEKQEEEVKANEPVEKQENRAGKVEEVEKVSVPLPEEESENKTVEIDSLKESEDKGLDEAPELNQDP